MVSVCCVSSISGMSPIVDNFLRFVDRELRVDPFRRAHAKAAVVAVQLALEQTLPQELVDKIARLVWATRHSSSWERSQEQSLYCAQ